MLRANAMQETTGNFLIQIHPLINGIFQCFKHQK